MAEAQSRYWQDLTTEDFAALDSDAQQQRNDAF